MQQIAIEVDHLCISYKGIKSFSIRKGLMKGEFFKPEEFQAVKDVSFKLEKGEILGLVGKNGSGKSTMLRAIAGIFSPNSGSVNLHGNSVSLLSIGVGFQKELSGRENILLAGLLLGFTEEQIREKEEAIIEFSELGRFIDSPVRTYSSGMYSKLAFSITAILETDIILIDEVLSVGDMRFRKKSYQKMEELIKDSNRTVVIVSHDTRTVSNLCTKVLWINDGEVVMFGNTAEVLRKYEETMTAPLPKVPVVKFSSNISGPGMSYQWQFRRPNKQLWNRVAIATCKDETLQVPALAFRAGSQYRCMVKDADGNVQYSQIYTLEIPTDNAET